MSWEHRASALLYSESVARLLPGGGVDPVASCSTRGRTGRVIDAQALQVLPSLFEAVLSLEASG